MPEYEIEETAKSLICDAEELISHILLKHAKAFIVGLRELHKEKRRIEKERDALAHRIGAIVINLDAGVPPKEVLRWHRDNPVTKE